MIKRYCDRCGQQIDEGVHVWYVLELHGTDGEFRHKELCEECYAYLCEKDEVPTANRKTEPQSVTYNPTSVNNIWEKPTNPYVPNEQTEPTISKMEQVDKDINVRSKDEPQRDTEIARAIVHKMIDDAVIAEDAYPDLRKRMHDVVDNYEPQTERSGE